MAYYKDLREYLATLEEHGKLIRIQFPVNKDTELHPLVRLQYRGLPESERKAFLFENITDSRGRRYAVPFAVCCMAGSTDIYALGLQCKPEEIVERWTRAQLNPIAPVLVQSGPVQEEVHLGETLLEHGGLDEFPVPISTPGFDSSAYFTAPYWVTKDPETGTRNVGTYRAQVKAPDRTGVFPCAAVQGLDIHWNDAKRRGQPMQAALVLGASPNIAYVSVSRLPHGLDEFSVAGGMAGEPIELVKCKTVDIEVPAHAEIVLEGVIATHEVEPEAPFGEATGFMGQRENMPYFQITAITHRKNPILQGFLSQFPPSESSKIRGMANENLLYTYLTHDCGIASVKDVALHEPSCSAFYTVVRLRKSEPSEAPRVVEALGHPRARLFGKIFVVVDEDIDPRDADAVNWAIGLRSQPHRDMHIVRHPADAVTMDFSIEPTGTALTRDPRFEDMPVSSILIIDATIKWPYPPVSLPKKEYMERALELWQKAGLPKLELKEPWWGYSLGYWTEEDEADARRAVQGEYYKTGEKNAGLRRRV